MKNNLAYVAGYIDGDGCFFFKTQTNPVKYRAEIIISSTSLIALQGIEHFFGGSIRPVHTKKSEWKQSYHWKLRGNSALEFTQNIVEFLTEKKGDAYIFMEFINESLKQNKQKLISKMRNHREETRKINANVIDELRNLECKGISNELDYAYLAGFIDAECCLGISKYKPKNRPNYTYKISLGCNNASPVIFYWLRERFGGSISLIKRHDKNPKHRDQIAWILNGNSLSKILPKILPFLITKKPVCEKLIEFYQTTLPNGGDRQSEEFKKSYIDTLSKREVIVEEVHKLNSKGLVNV